LGTITTTSLLYPELQDYGTMHIQSIYEVMHLPNLNNHSCDNSQDTMLLYGGHGLAPN
jgi:hypothetical protein